MKKSMRRFTLSSDPRSDKARLRAELRGEIEDLPAEYTAQSDRAITQKLLKLPEIARAKTVFAYVSVRREVSTHELIRSLLADKRRVALPVCGENGKMDFFLLSSETELRPGKFGIPEPEQRQLAVPEKGDVIIVPALSCDGRGNRLGHGGGYYDRYLASHGEAFSVCLCRKRLMCDAIPMEDTDVSTDAVVTD